MTVNWGQIWEYIAFVLLLFISNRMSGTLGGMFYAGVALTNRIPWFGWLFRYILRSPLYLNVVIKSIAWMISSSGLLIGVIIHNFAWGSPNTATEYWILLLFAVVAIFEILDDMITFDSKYYYINHVMKEMKNIPLLKDHTLHIVDQPDKEAFIRLARSGFVNQAIPDFFRLLVSIGAVYYTLANLELINSSTNINITIWNAIIIAFSLIDITGEVVIPFTGTTWEIIRLLSAFISFFWLVMFVTLVSSSVDDAAAQAYEEAQERADVRMRAMMEAMLAERDKQEADSAKPRDISQVKIIEALIDPIGGRDSGSETVTLHNFSDTAITIEGWQLEDSSNNRLVIPSMVLAAKGSHRISIPEDTIYLRNSRGYIMLHDQNDTIVDSVEYDRADIDGAGIVKWLS